LGMPAYSQARLYLACSRVSSSVVKETVGETPTGLSGREAGTPSEAGTPREVGLQDMVHFELRGIQNIDTIR